MTEVEEKPEKPITKKKDLDFGKFRNHCRQNNRGIPDGDILLPETVRNRAVAAKVDSLMQSGQFKSRRAARKSLHK